MQELNSLASDGLTEKELQRVKKVYLHIFLFNDSIFGRVCHEQCA